MVHSQRTTYSEFFSKFDNSLDETDMADRVQIGYSELDRIQTYNYNSLGYRGNEFTTNLELLCSGDSETFGVGLPESATWPSMLASSAGIRSYANMAIPGSSVHSIVSDIFTYIRNFGPPKNLFISFPDFSRFYFWSTPDLFITKDKPERIGPCNAQLGPYWGRQPKYSKIPHLVEDIISKDHCYFMSIQMIHFLEDICDLHNINLKWTIWKSPDDLDLILDLRKDHPNLFRHFFFNDSEDWSRGAENRRVCHTPAEYEDIKDVFHIATDKPPGHDGAHRHIHVAEEFSAFLK